MISEFQTKKVNDKKLFKKFQKKNYFALKSFKVFNHKILEAELPPFKYQKKIEIIVMEEKTEK